MSKQVKYNSSQILLEFNLNNIKSKNFCFFISIVIENQILKKIGLRMYFKPTLS